MPCPTCDHTLEGIGHGVFHCPRCGTLTNCPVDGAVHVPALVGRCRTFSAFLFCDFTLRYELQMEWGKLGIAESIRPPKERAEATP